MFVGCVCEKGKKVGVEWSVDMRSRGDITNSVYNKTERPGKYKRTLPLLLTGPQ